MMCAAVIIINLTVFPWNTNDEKVLESARRVCKVQYGPRSPCVKKIIKQKAQDYRVMCGQAQEG